MSGFTVRTFLEHEDVKNAKIGETKIFVLNSDYVQKQAKQAQLRGHLAVQFRC